MHHREREFAWLEGFNGQVKKNRGVLSSAEEENRPLALRCDLSKDEDRLRLEQIEVVDSLSSRSVNGHDARSLKKSLVGNRVRGVT
jgi:hypothetical protein